MRAIWLLPVLHLAVSAGAGYHYVRHMFALAAAYGLGWEAPEATWAQMLFWLFNMPCLLGVNLLSGIVPLSWQPQDYTRMWVVQPIVLLASAVLNTGFWFWLGAQWEEPGERVTWWRLVVAALGIGVATGVLFHTRGVDLQVIPFVVWPLLMAGWAMRVAALLPVNTVEPGDGR